MALIRDVARPANKRVMLTLALIMNDALVRGVVALRVSWKISIVVGNIAAAVAGLIFFVSS